MVESAHLIMLHSILPKSEVRGVIAGAFDLIHPGYVKMFKEAKKHCTHLTVALHEDPSLENGKRKPIHSLEEREEILRSITYVDDIRIYWNEYGLSQYLQVGKFDVRFLGDDYKDKDYTGKDLDLKIIWIDRNHSYSTTRLKKLIKDNE